MKKFKALCLVLASVVAMGSVSMFSACGASAGEEIDETKTQLKVGNLYLGYGDEWLQAWKKSFEAKYANTQFEEGKLGVQVQIDNQSEAYNQNTILTSFSAYDQDLYFTGDAYIRDYVGQGICAEITDMVKEDLSSKYPNETGSIEDKMHPEVRDAMQLNGKYYLMPFYQVNHGLNYDIDLFYEKGFFISKRSTEERTIFTNNSADFSAGVDGEYGTFDDGLPATYVQFYDMLAKMKQATIVPFIWSGVHAWSYTTSFTKLVWISQDGLDQMKLNQTFDGQATTLVNSITPATKKYGSVNYDVSSVTLKSTPTTITTSNGYELQKQAGKFYALQLASNIVKDESNYDALSFGGSLTHTGAQTEYLYSRYNYNKKPIAMLIDAGWWRAEAKSTFKDMVDEYGEEASMANRRFGWMPIPRPNSEMIGGTWSANGQIAKAFISSNCPEDKLELAKLFLQFCYTQESLRTFTELTESIMPFDYGFTSEAEENAFLDKLTIFGRNIWQLNKTGNIYLDLYGYTNPIVLNNYTYFRDPWCFSTQTGVGSATYPFVSFHTNSQLTAKLYFEGLYEKHSTNTIWN